MYQFCDGELSLPTVLVVREPCSPSFCLLILLSCSQQPQSYPPVFLSSLRSFFFFSLKVVRKIKAGRESQENGAVTQLPSPPAVAHKKPNSPGNLFAFAEVAAISLLFAGGINTRPLGGVHCYGAFYCVTQFRGGKVCWGARARLLVGQRGLFIIRILSDFSKHPLIPLLYEPAGDPAAGIGNEEDDGGEEEEDEDGACVAFLDDFFSFIQGNSAAKGPGCAGGWGWSRP